MILKIKDNYDYNKSEKINRFDLIILVYCLIQPLILRWAINKELIKLVQVFIAFYYLMKILKLNKIKKSTLVLVNIIILYVSINVIKNGIQPYFYENLIVYGIGNITIMAFFLNFMLKKDIKLIQKILEKFIFIINFYFIINVPIMLLQLNNTYFMMRYHESNRMYEDHITGLIGASGTHRLTFFWITLIIANMYYYSKKNNKILLIYMIAQVFFMAVMSSYSDNTAFFIMFPLIIIQSIFITMRRFNIKVLLKYTSFVILITYIGMPLLMSNEQVKYFYETRVLEKIYQYTGQSNKHSSNIKDNEERIELYQYALEHGDGYELGKGIGSVTYGDYRMPAHFGMSEISIKAYEGGIIYLILLISMYAYYSYKIITSNNNISYKGKLFVFFIVTMNLVLFSIYTQIFMCSELIIFWTISLSILRVMINIKNEKVMDTYKY